MCQIKKSLSHLRNSSRARRRGPRNPSTTTAEISASQAGNLFVWRYRLRLPGGRIIADCGLSSGCQNVERCWLHAYAMTCERAEAIAPGARVIVINPGKRKERAAA